MNEIIQWLTLGFMAFEGIFLILLWLAHSNLQRNFAERIDKNEQTNAELALVLDRLTRLEERTAHGMSPDDLREINSRLGQIEGQNQAINQQLLTIHRHLMESKK